MKITRDVDLIYTELMMELYDGESNNEKYFVSTAPRFNLRMLQHLIHLES